MDGEPDGVDPDEVALTGAEAVAAWRGVRGTVFAVMIGAFAVFGTVWLIWRPPVDRLTWLGFGLGAVALAVVRIRHGLAEINYETTTVNGEKEAEFVARRATAPNGCAVPVLLMAAILFFLAATTTGVGRWLASVFGVVETLYSAGENAIGIVLLPVAALFAAIIIVIMAGFGLGLTVMGLYSLVTWVARGFKRGEDDETGLAMVLVGLVVLGVLTLGVLGTWVGREQIVDDMLEPFRKIGDWF